MPDIEAEKIYDQLMALNRETFAGGLFEASYHALVSAFYVASSLQADKLLSLIAQRAQEQLWWFDHYAEDHPFSSASATRNERQNLYDALVDQAQTQRKKAEWDRKYRKPSASSEEM
ncbi:hypothetical protein [Dictyobacter aurantiacus]|uniref:Uncharacterized protein n=1 Tax=Dictyobacter aurantiacus TaxID=1936993 RepID=A0A401Z8U7_9CHLR|nr:hypothetical protein [Dictyobacter aurantiacus]GCE03297.1 hypothetical protein KDAU_06260 [Dictyobacter aurantiacus]